MCARVVSGGVMKSGDDPAASYVMLLWLKKRLYSGNSFLFVLENQKRENSDDGFHSPNMSLAFSS